MDFNYSPEDEAFRREFRTWLEQNRPDRPIQNLAGGFEQDEEDWQRKLAWYRKLASGGWTCVDWPREFGGRGLDTLKTIIYHEELQRIDAPLPFIGSGPSLVGPTLMQWGTAEQKQRFIPKIITGEEIWCQGYSEPNSGSDLASLQTRATEEGDYFVINGQKIWTSQAQYADWAFVLCRTDPDAPKHRGISYILVNMKTPGITVRPLVQMSGARGFNEVFFDDVRTPKNMLVGAKNQGWQVAITTLMYERGMGGGGQPLSSTQITLPVRSGSTLHRRATPSTRRRPRPCSLSGSLRVG